MNIPLSGTLKDIINNNFKYISNLNLLLTKYVRGWSNNWQFKREVIERDNRGRERRREVNIKFEHPEAVIQNVQYDRETYNKYFIRWKSLLKNINTTSISGKVQWRLVVGIGSGSVLETSMTLHHILGVPFIPGSALKGVVSSYYIENNRENLTQNMRNTNSKRREENKKEYKALEEFVMNEDETYKKLFGNENQKGKVTFFDAYPTQFPELEMDIMNPHYPDYYGDTTGKIPPADWMSPVPIKFLTVKKDTEFVFAFKTEYKKLKEAVKPLIMEVLENSGLGTKTSVGYGYFRDLKDYVIEQANDSEISTSNIISEKPKQELAGYLKNENELKDEYLKPDKTMKSEDEYRKVLVSLGKDYSKGKKQQFDKARKWYEKNQSSKK